MTTRAATAAIRGRRTRKGADTRLYVTAGVLVAALVFAGFARTYYLRTLFTARTLTPLLHLHGLLMSGWIALFVTQASLVAKHRQHLHRQLGAAGAVLAAAIVLVGSLTVGRAIARRFPDASAARFLRIFVEFDGLSLWVFGALVVAAVLWRSRPETHKRLMLAATLALLPPVIGRIAEHLAPAGDFNLSVAALTTCAVLLITAAVDTARHGRLHPAMAYGAAAVVAANVLTRLAQIGD